MNCSVFSGRIDNEFHIVLSGYLDTSASKQTQDDIEKTVAGLSSDEKIVIDLDHLDFISSSGLRTMLSLRKRFSNLSLINASQKVYEVFEMTRLTRMIPIRKKMRRINIDDCPEIGRGGVSSVYRLSEDTVIKVFPEESVLDDITKEINLAKEAFVLGLPTAMSFEIVKVDTLSGIQYGLIYELLEADTLCNVISEYPEKLEYYARKFAGIYKNIHSIEISEEVIIPSAHDNAEKAIDKISKYFDKDIIDKARELLAELPSGNSLLHGDLQTKNVMLQGDELMFMDVSEMSYGNPLIDIGHTYSTMMLCNGDYKHVNGITEQQGHRFFEIVLDEYFKDTSEEEKTRSMEMIRKIGCLRSITWLALSDFFPQEIIEKCGRRFKSLTGL